MASEQSPVPFTKENVMKCKCGSCPIHRQSACIKELVENLGNHMEILDKDPLQKEEIPGMYCAKGRGPFISARAAWPGRSAGRRSLDDQKSIFGLTPT